MNAAACVIALESVLAALVCHQPAYRAPFTWMASNATNAYYQRSFIFQSMGIQSSNPRVDSLAQISHVVFLPLVHGGVALVDFRTSKGANDMLSCVEIPAPVLPLKCLGGSSLPLATTLPFHSSCCREKKIHL